MSGRDQQPDRWPPIQIARDEWIVMRTERARPAAVVKRFVHTSGAAYFRCVTWAERSADRRLLGRFRTLAEADSAVPASASASISAPGFTPTPDPVTPAHTHGAAAASGQPTDAWERGATPWDAAPRRTNRYA